jgi:hypothetical protein
LIMSEAFSAIMMVGAVVLPEVMVGMIEASKLGLRQKFPRFERQAPAQSRAAV